VISYDYVYFLKNKESRLKKYWSYVNWTQMKWQQRLREQTRDVLCTNREQRSEMGQALASSAPRALGRLRAPDVTALDPTLWLQPTAYATYTFLFQGVSNRHGWAPSVNQNTVA
jgi:hypothetical protein